MPGFQLKGLTALITGASKGIGKACALALAQGDGHVIAVARNEEDLIQLASQSQNIEVWTMDVTTPEFLRRVRELDRLDILVNNVGTNRPEPFVDVSEENLDIILGLNVRQAFLVAQAAVRVMLRADNGGSIIHMSSQMGHVGAPNRSVYCMTKHAIEGLTKAMAVELAPHQIRVNSVAPTFVETPMTRPMFEKPEFRAYVENMIPMGHVASVDDVANAVLYLASPLSRMVTGTSLKVDGGWTAH